MGALSGGPQWGPSVGAVSGGPQWGPSVGALSGGRQWGPSVGALSESVVARYGGSHKGPKTYIMIITALHESMREGCFP